MTSETAASICVPTAMIQLNRRIVSSVEVSNVPYEASYFSSSVSGMAHGS